MLGDENEESKELDKKVYTRKKQLKEVTSGKTSSNMSREQQSIEQARVSEGIHPVKRLRNMDVDAGSDNFSGLNRNGLSGNGGFLKEQIKVRISLSISKHEARELRRKLESERDLIQSLMRKIEATDVHKNGGRAGNVGGDKAASGVGPPRMSKPLNQLSVSIFENSKSGNDNMGKEKRTPKANKLYRNSDFLLAKDKFPSAECKKLKSNGKKGGGSDVGTFSSQVFKSCKSLLEKLMKHKNAWVFNKPVDVVALGLHDYFDVIKNPMDLGTVKNRLTQNWYNTPVEFAEDVRLTFRNAMTYNSKEQDVYVMAEQLSKIFEDKWAPIEADYTRELKHAVDLGSPTPTSRKAPSQPPSKPDTKQILDRAESATYSINKKEKSKAIVQSGRIPVPKKPKARDPNKREMTYDEKQKLSLNLQSLPTEKLESVVKIIKKRNPSLTQKDDEIEVDIDIVDTETLWELDRFITNYKKGLSKNKRKAEIVGELIAGPEEINPKKIPTSTVTETPRGIRTDKERVISPPIQVDEPGAKDTNHGGSQSSSGSDSGSSSSESDGESSSEDGSVDKHSPKDQVVEVE